MCPIGSLVSPKKTVRTHRPGKILQSHKSGPSGIAICHKLKNSISRLLKGVQSSITTLKCSEDSHYGVRIKVLKFSDLSFSSYWPRPFSDPRFWPKNGKSTLYPICLSEVSFPMFIGTRNRLQLFV